jgi:hypothetical protein
VWWERSAIFVLKYPENMLWSEVYVKDKWVHPTNETLMMKIGLWNRQILFKIHEKRKRISFQRMRYKI